MRNRVALAGTFVFALTACAPKENATVAKADLATAVSVVPAAPIVAGAATAAPAPNVVIVHAVDFAYSSAPAQVPAGMTTFRMINDGHTLHHVEIVRLDSGKTLANLQDALAKPAAAPAWAAPQGGPNASDPSKETNATLDLRPGNYVMLCFVDVPGGVPHFAKGMVHPFTVTAVKAGPQAAAPAADVGITLTDFGFALSTPLTAGSHTFAVRNTAAQPHEVQLVRLAPGKTLNDFMGWLLKPVGPPPGSAIGGISPFIRTTNYFTADITPGHYALICFIPDVKDGKPHFMHGMTKSITVI